MDKIYSCTQFFNELDLLELRLETLDPVVDYFVISESTKTHSGKDKPLYYQENKSRFKKFHDKIIHQIITDTPSNYANLKHNGSFEHDYLVDTINSQTHWNKNIESYGRDSWEKECLILPFLDCSTSDLYDNIVLLSDLDEIVRPESLKETLKDFDPLQTYHFQHSMFYYYLNVEKNEPWYGTLATSLGNFITNSFCDMRTNKHGIFIENAGWHFTYMGGLDKVKKKIHSWGEQSLNTEAINNNLQNNFENFIELGRDLFFRPAQWKIRDINDGTFPQYLVDHQDDIFKKYIYKNS